MANEYSYYYKNKIFGGSPLDLIKDTTQANYDAMSETEKANSPYIWNITDASSSITADSVGLSSVSGISSDNVQGAIGELTQNITNIDNKVTWKEVSTMGVVPSTATEVKFVIIGGSSVFQNIFDYSLFTSDLQWFEVGGFYLNASSNARAVVQASKNALGVRKLYMGGAEQTITFKMFYH